jgi:hypothetical protein
MKTRKTSDADAAAAIRASCKRNWDAFKDDCSGFLKSVANEFLDIVPPGQADNIIDFLRISADWTRLGTDLAAAAAAAQHAGDGEFVVGGLRGNELNPKKNNGHVVVVVSGELVNSKYPHAYWGVLNGVGKKDAGVNWAFNANDRDRVEYFARGIDKIPTISFVRVKRRTGVRLPRTSRKILGTDIRSPGKAVRSKPQTG